MKLLQSDSELVNRLSTDRNDDLLVITRWLLLVSSSLTLFSYSLSRKTHNIAISAKSHIHRHRVIQYVIGYQTRKLKKHKVVSV